jgi:hypothetical protein
LEEAVATDDTVKQKGLAQLKDMLDHWSEKDSDFRSYVSWRSDMFKMVGAGNTSGIFALAVFLTTSTRTGGIVFAAKLCLIIYAVGFGLFVYAYRTLYRCVGHIEDCLISLRRGLPEIDKAASVALDESQQTGMPIFSSVLCFFAASLIAILGLLIHG